MVDLKKRLHDKMLRVVHSFQHWLYQSCHEHALAERATDHDAHGSHASLLGVCAFAHMQENKSAGAAAAESGLHKQKQQSMSIEHGKTTTSQEY